RDPAPSQGDRGLPGHGLRTDDAGMSGSMLELADVHTYYGSIRALRGVSLSVAPGEIVTLIGSNGAGKTTTLRTILGTARPPPGPPPRHRHVRRPAPGHPADRPHRGSGHRAIAGGPPDLSADDRAREPRARRLRAEGPRGDRLGSRARLRTVPAAGAALDAA